MNAHRRPLQPLSPLSANNVGAKYGYITKVGANVDLQATMDEQAQDDNSNTQGSGSIVSGLTSLENDADDFDRLMIQNARDERRLQDALRGNVHPFRKARTHPRVGLTLENLERNNARNEEGVGGGARERKFKSPSSSTGSTRSDPPVRPPAQWGRKGRVRSNWLRAITSDEEQTRGAQEDTIDRLVEDATPRQTDRAGYNAEADVPRLSIEDSPLSRKSSYGTPGSMRRMTNAPLDGEMDWDLTLDFNEASMIASTPYVPRSTVLDDIRQREIESLKEQAVTTNRLDRIRENSPEETRRPKSISLTLPFTTTLEQGAEGAGLPQTRERKRTNSWKNIGRSQAVTGEPSEQVANSPIVVIKKSSETVGVVDRGLLANAQTNVQRPTHRREDSQDLLRRLARVSSGTPSPGRVAASRPQTAPANQQENDPSKMISSTPALPSDEVKAPWQLSKAPRMTENAVALPEEQLPKETPVEINSMAQSAPALLQQPTIPGIDTTPVPVERSLLNAKTPIVTGAWIDTPGPRTVRRSASTEEVSRPRSRSPKKSNPSTKSPQKQMARQPEEKTTAPPEPVRPTLPRSALEAIVEEAKANVRGPRHEDQFGDSTIDSLEDLIAADGESEKADPDEDTLQGLELPTEPPRTEAERQRRKELIQLHRMNQRLRNARTSIRDASRGIKRVEHRVEHVEENGESIKVVYRDCPCVDGHNGSPWSSTWTGFKHLFYQPRSPKRRGLTWLTIFIVAFWVWFISEAIACEKYCHPLYATRMVGYGVDINNPAPEFPFVIPTMTYRKLVKPFWLPLWAFIRWIGLAAYNSFFDVEAARPTPTQSILRFAATRAQETFEPDFRMADDEVI